MVPVASDAQLLFDPDTFTRGVPFEVYARLRRDSPVVWIEEPPAAQFPGGPGFWLVLRHGDVETVLRHPEVFSSALGGTQTRSHTDPEALRFVRRMMLNMDPPEHGRLRRLLTKSFTPRAVAHLEARIAQHAREIVAEMVGSAAGGQCDLVELCADLPLRTLVDVLGIPPQDRLLLYDWANRVVGDQDPDHRSSDRFDPATGTAMAREAIRLRPQPDADGVMPDPRVRAGMPDLYAYAHLLAQAKRRDPGDDVMSILLAQVDVDGGQVGIEEFENLFWLFSVAGNETLRNGLPGALVALLQEPGLQQQLRTGGVSVGACEELLRWWTPVMTFRRTAVADTALAGVPIAAGQKVIVSFVSANRDEAVFSEPDRVELGRQPNPHLSFSHGPHFCLGARLALAQMQALIAELLRRTRSLEAVGEPTYLRSTFARGMKTLPARWIAAP